MGTPDRLKPTKLDRAWPWLSLFPLGLGAWGLIYAGLRARQRWWTAVGVLCTVAVSCGWIIAGVSESEDNGGAGAVLLLGWVGAIAVSFGLRGPFGRRMNSPWRLALEAGRDRLEERAAALELVQRDPALAAEVGIGRPDEGDDRGAGLIDVNNASLAALLTLPRVDDDLALQIFQQRTELDGFASLEDLGAALDLGGSDVEALRGLVVFLPRRR